MSVDMTFGPCLDRVWTGSVARGRRELLEATVCSESS
jgi:hypothetical protein